MRSLRPVGPAALVCTMFAVLLTGRLPPVVRYGPLLVSVAILGFPHGAVDHVAVAGVLRGRADHGASTDGTVGFLSGVDVPASRSLLAVALLYAVLGGAYLLIWFWRPVLAAVGFVLLTWFHWGQGELYHLLATHDRTHLETGLERGLALLVRGGLPMLVPLLGFPSVYRRVLTALAAVFVATPRIPPWPFLLETRVILGIGFGSLTILALGWSYRYTRATGKRRAWGYDAGEVLLQWVFFVLVPPILAIGVYFTFWHSLRHVRRVVWLADLSGEDSRQSTTVAGRSGVGELDGPALRRFTRAALPNTLGALVLFAAVYAVGTARSGLLAVAAAYLVAIAVLTLPHTAAVTWLDAQQSVWTGTER